ncbi:MAG: hypothetical protein U5K54_03945 [Cytophagales bacterium]|nr:hypothetical protein [Cytophagales bacterium]
MGYGAEGMLYANDEDNLAATVLILTAIFIGIDFDLTAIKSRSRAINTSDLPC